MRTFRFFIRDAFLQADEVINISVQVMIRYRHRQSLSFDLYVLLLITTIRIHLCEHKMIDHLRAFRGFMASFRVRLWSIRRRAYIAYYYY